MGDKKTQQDEKPESNLPVLRLAETTYKGVVTYCFELPEIEKMAIRDDDIWVCSFPRSGMYLVDTHRPYNVRRMVLVVFFFAFLLL